jgi:GNAT superfamily N-acetyltransferase
MSAVLIASITELCAADHRNDQAALGGWLANKTPQSIAQWFDNPASHLLVAERDGGIAAIGGYNDAREITLNYVAPAHRFAGVSRALLAAMEQALGPGEAMLTSTRSAHRFYLARGWRDFGAIETYAGMDAYPMRKTLT